MFPFMSMTWRISTLGQFKDAHAKVIRSFESGHSNNDLTKDFVTTLKTQTSPWLMDSQTKYLALAAGFGDVLFYLLPPNGLDYRWKIWDVAPGALVVQEAGGRVSDLDGNPLDFSCGERLAHNSGILVSNGLTSNPFISSKVYRNSNPCRSALVILLAFLIYVLYP